MRNSLVRALRTAAVALAVVSCTSDSPLAPRLLAPGAGGARTDASVVPGLYGPAIVISQVYGGGGNSGATIKNDFIELFNRTASDIKVDNWSVQYSAAGGSSWTATALSGSIPANGYYLVQESSGGANGSISLVPDATGTLTLAAGAGKVALATSTTPLTGTCPTGATVVDQVSFGSTATDCGRKQTGNLSNTTAALRARGGCAFSDLDLSSVFTVGSPSPRNRLTTPLVCPPTPSMTLSPGSASVNANETQSFSAAYFDANGNPQGTSFTWTVGDATIASVDANGIVTGLKIGSTTVTARAADGTSAISNITVSGAVSTGDLVISQVYGGGGNAGAPYAHDYIEIFNRGASAVNLAGWSVQYASTSGSFTQATPLSGVVAPNSYYLVQETAGNAASADLPTPDFSTGGINLSGTAGKVLLARTATPLSSESCPATTNVIIDVVPYGSGNNCGSTPVAPAPSNTTAIFRKNAGCLQRSDASRDFTAAAPAPRNSSTAAHSCVAGPLKSVTISGSPSLVAGGTSQFTATSVDANGNEIDAQVVWTSSNPALATVSASGLVTAIAASGDEPLIITASATVGDVTASATAPLVVSNPGVINWIDVSYASSPAPLKPGFQTQIFLTARDARGGTVIPATFTVESLDGLLSVIQAPTGIIVNANAPTDASSFAKLKITATPTSGGGAAYPFTTSASTSVTIAQPIFADKSIYAVNDEFGRPTNAGTDVNDFLIARTQYTLSYNQSHGGPNWVSYELDKRQRGGEDRCNCFTAEPNIPADKQIFASDYTNSKYDRGHMTRSADRTAANMDNAATYYLSNVVPQTPDLNEGVWAQFENTLGDSADAGRAVYIITGPSFNGPLSYITNDGSGASASSGRVAIPTTTWKVALIGPRINGVPFTKANIQTWDDLAGLTLLAVNMPNIANVRNNPWAMYLTTVDELQELTGYNFLSGLPELYQTALEAGDHAPKAAFSATGTQAEGSSMIFDASSTTDPDLGRSDLSFTEALTYAWHFSDGTNASGPSVTHAFADNGTYTVALTVSDKLGWQSVVTRQIVISNVAPTATIQATPLSLNEGGTFTVSLTNPVEPSSVDAAHLSYSFDCGEGFGTASATATVTCPAKRYGTLTVQARISDKDGDGTTYSLSSPITVNNVPPAIDRALRDSSLLQGETYAQAETFTDPGLDPFVATAVYGDAPGAQTLSLAGHAFTISHEYDGAGSFMLTATVSDGLSSASVSARVTVLTPSQGVDNLSSQVDALGSLSGSTISRLVSKLDKNSPSTGEINALKVKLRNANEKLAAGDKSNAVEQLNQFIHDLQTLVVNNKLTQSAIDPLVAYTNRVITSITR